MAEWEWDKEGNEYIERILREILPLLLSQTEEALKEVFAKARFFVSFEDLTKYILSALEERVGLTPSAKDFISQELRKIYEKTQIDILKDFPIRYKFAVPDQRALEYAEKLHDFYLGRFFRGDRELRLRVLNWMSRYYLEEGNPIGKGQRGIQKFLEQFGQYVKPQTEWKARQVIDTSVNYLRNSARIRAMQKAGTRKFRWDSIGDRLVCPACRSMDGRIFEVADAARVLDTIEGSEDPSILKEVRPIMTQPYKGPSSSAPVKSPPAHPLCRCTVVSWTEESEDTLPTTVERPQGVPDTPTQIELEKEYSSFSKEELSNRIKAHLGSDWRRMSGGKFDESLANLSRHFSKHSRALGIKSVEEYTAKSYEIIGSPDKVYVQRLPNGETDFVFIKGKQVVVSNDDGLFVKTFHKMYITEEEWVKNAISKGFATIRIL